MDTQEFSQRFGILLEAYLKGCGETMFVSRLRILQYIYMYYIIIYMYMYNDSIARRIKTLKG